MVGVYSGTCGSEQKTIMWQCIKDTSDGYIVTFRPVKLREGDTIKDDANYFVVPPKWSWIIRQYWEAQGSPTEGVIHWQWRNGKFTRQACKVERVR